MIVYNFDEALENADTDAKKRSTQFYPADVIPMWIADTDFRCPQPVIDAIIDRARAGRYGYTVTSERLKEAVAGWMKKRFGWTTSPSCVEFCPGVMAGVTAAVRALTIPGDNIVIHTPCYTPFMKMAQNNGRNLLRNKLVQTGKSYSVDFADLEEKLSLPRTRLLILCNPQNPTGLVFNREELLEIGRLCRKYRVYVISDEIHCDYVYNCHCHIPFASVDKSFSEFCITFVNPSKTFNIAGLHTAAFICENSRIKSMIHEVLMAQKNCSENVFGTAALCAAYESCDDYADQVVAYIESNIQTAIESLTKIDGINIVAPEGTYLLWIDCREWKMSQAELMDFFVEEAKVGVSSGTDYGPEGEGFVRMNLACTKMTLSEALARIHRAAETFRSKLAGG